MHAPRRRAWRSSTRPNRSTCCATGPRVADQDRVVRLGRRPSVGVGRARGRSATSAARPRAAVVTTSTPSSTRRKTGMVPAEVAGPPRRRWRRARGRLRRRRSARRGIRSVIVHVPPATVTASPTRPRASRPTPRTTKTTTTTARMARKRVTPGPDDAGAQPIDLSALLGDAGARLDCACHASGSSSDARVLVLAGRQPGVGPTLEPAVEHGDVLVAHVLERELPRATPVRPMRTRR